MNLSPCVCVSACWYPASVLRKKVSMRMAGCEPRVWLSAMLPAVAVAAQPRGGMTPSDALHETNPEK
eukprot:CAMPEP_0183397254 /NCGR_PEP_ID=MMETSP0370-20130417/10475_1 /TAXON_ID=268820 /ORGANISM="Peridinium aciculiferum, Strain PAER-2" /LENGTH=66 /DNA_ID=CAMNT_0025578107 /DNA_START=966 /DNA_END=1163 /DNA_ORIENTATION=+